jgi:hypothetical protein
MTTVAQMIEWMKTLPQDAEVDCGVEVTYGNDTCMVYRDVKIDQCEVFDYTDESYKGSMIFGKVIVRVCGE